MFTLSIICVILTLVIIITYLGRIARIKYNKLIDNVNDAKNNITKLENNVNNIQTQVDSFRSKLEYISEKVEAMSKKPTRKPRAIKKDIA